MFISLLSFISPLSLSLSLSCAGLFGNASTGGGLGGGIFGQTPAATQASGGALFGQGTSGGGLLGGTGQTGGGLFQTPQCKF